jgi:hypothetical protein
MAKTSTSTANSRRSPATTATGGSPSRQRSSLGGEISLVAKVPVAAAPKQMQPQQRRSQQMRVPSTKKRTEGSGGKAVDSGESRPSRRSVGGSAAAAPVPPADGDDDDDDDDEAVSTESSTVRKSKRCQAPRQSRANESTSIYNRLWAPLLLLPPIRVRSATTATKLSTVI